MMDEKAENHVYFGSKETSNLVIVAGAGKNQVSLHCHWEVLASACPFFEKMRSSNMRESTENMVRFEQDDPNAWKALIGRLYPPLEYFTFISANQCLPLVHRLEMTWLVPELKRILSSPAEANLRTPAFADMICECGLSEVVDAWFQETNWALTAALIFLTDCASVEVKGFATKFVAADHARLIKKLNEWRGAVRDVLHSGSKSDYTSTIVRNAILNSPVDKALC